MVIFLIASIFSPSCEISYNYWRNLPKQKKKPKFIKPLKTKPFYYRFIPLPRWMNHGKRLRLFNPYLFYESSLSLT